ncbi:MAG: DUF1566 domain-containing protein [Paludibacteraceae bacterium]|nr:DUF1566 domain-containing protein [Paludibacteraceae bacterium]
MNKYLYWIILFLTFLCGETVSQNLSLKDINKLRVKNDWADIDKLLSSKGWVADKPELLKDNQTSSLTWSLASAGGVVKLEIERGWKTKSSIHFTLPEKDAPLYIAKVVGEYGYKEEVSLKSKRFYKHRNELALAKTMESGVTKLSFTTKDSKYWDMLLSSGKDPDVRSLDTYQIGDYIEEEGGILFYVSENADYGYILAMTDANNGSGCEWGADSTDIPGKYPFTSREWHEANYDMEGEANTKAVVDFLDSHYPATTKYATQLASNYGGGGKNDWYLPSEGQLRMIKDIADRLNNRLRVNQGVSLAKTWYWSSSEYDKNFAWAVNFGSKIVGRSTKKGMDRVRAVRTMRVEE